jgi:hypothetical protein
MRYAKIENETVVNIIAASAQIVATLPGEYVEAGSAAIGYVRVDGELVAPEPVPALQLPITDITVTETRFKVGDTITFDFASALPDDSYYIPYRVDGDGRKYLKDAVVTGGAGAISFTFDRGGIYYIDREDLPLTELHVNGSPVERFTIYVAE